jgi:dimethylargininase
MIALTHQPSPRMQSCQRTFVPDTQINLALAHRQHADYCQALSECGAVVRTLNVNSQFPDCTFIEDTAVVLDEVAILCSMGTASRQAEPAGIEPVLREYRAVERILPPTTLEGGDVLRIGRRLLVGQSSRTNAAGISALESIAAKFDYRVTPVPVRGSLHLKTACTALPDSRLLVNPIWLDLSALSGYDLLPVPPSEPFGANLCLIEGNVLLPDAHPQTADLLTSRGYKVRAVDISEFAKAEGGVTCLSLLFSEGL